MFSIQGFESMVQGLGVKIYGSGVWVKVKDLVCLGCLGLRVLRVFKVFRVKGLG